MGCGASAPVAAEAQESLEYQPGGRLPDAKTMQNDELPDRMKNEMVDDALADMLEAEREAVSFKPEFETFVGSVLIARAKAKDEAEIMMDASVRLQAHKYDVRERMDVMEQMIDGMHSDFATVANVRDPATGRAPRGKDFGGYLDDPQLNMPRRLDGGLKARQQAEREQISQIIVWQHEMVSERWRDDPLEAVLAGETAEAWEAKVQQMLGTKKRRRGKMSKKFEGAEGEADCDTDEAADPLKEFEESVNKGLKEHARRLLPR